MERSDDNILLLVDRIDGPTTVSSIPTIEASEKEANIWAFQGVHGGAGVTSLAVEIAHELAHSTEKFEALDEQILLIDLDFERGSCAAFMDVQPSLKIEELNAAAGRMDESLAGTFVRKYSKNLSVIIAEGELGGNDLIDPTALLSLLDSVSTMFDYIVLDIPLMWRSWTQAVIGAADKFTLVTELSVPALHKTKELSDQITIAMGLPQQPHVLVNKYERRSLRGGVTLKDAVRVLDRDDLLTVTIDDDTVRQSINSGEPAGKLRPESRYSKGVRLVVQQWNEEIKALKAIQSTSVEDKIKIA